MVSRRRKIIDLLIAQALPMATSMIMLIATASMLGPSGRGEFALIVSTATLLSALCFLSLHVGAVYGHRSGDSSAPRRILMLASCISAALAVAGAIGYVAMPAGVHVGEFDRRTVALACLGGALASFHLVAGRTRQGLGESHVFRNSSIVVSVSFVVIGLPMASITRSAIIVVLVWLGSLVAGTCVVLFSPARREEAVASHRIPLLDLVRRSAYVHVGTSGQQLLFRADVVVLGALSTASAVGVYSVAAPLAGLVWVIAESLSLLAFDEGMGSGKGGNRSLGRNVRLNFVLGSIAAIPIAFGSWLVLPLILPEFEGATILILILLPGVVIQGYARIVLSHLSTRDDPRPVMWIGVTSALLGLLYIPFVAVGGEIGAALGSTSVYVLQTFVIWLYIRKKFPGGI